MIKLVNEKKKRNPGEESLDENTGLTVSHEPAQTVRPITEIVADFLRFNLRGLW